MDATQTDPFGVGQTAAGSGRDDLAGVPRALVDRTAREALFGPEAQLGHGSFLGVGTDLVHVPTFEETLSAPGSHFAGPGRVFTPREHRRAVARAAAKGDSLAIHLAALWALKEAALKAWLGALNASGGSAPLREDEVNWSEITVDHDHGGAPTIVLRGRMSQAFQQSFGALASRWSASASHEGDYALAFVVLQ